MLKNYFLVALRSFWRNKTFSLINILGLAIGISASLIIFLLVYYDFTFDKFEKDGSRIYRVVEDFAFEGKPPGHNSDVCVPMGPAIEKELTGIEAVVPFHLADETRVTIPNAGQPRVFKKQTDLVFADARYFDLIHYDWLAGSPTTAIQQPYQVVLTEKKAAVYFPGLAYSDIVGKTLFLDDTIQVAVTGIVKAITANTDFDFNVFISRSSLETSRLSPGYWNEWSTTSSADQLFVRLAPGASSTRLSAQMTQLFTAHTPPNPDKRSSIAFNLQPLSDLHFDTTYNGFDNGRTAHKPTLYGLLAVAAFLLVLACINFINLTTAQASQRAKEIGIRKTMGSNRGQLSLQFLSETFLLTLIATLLSIALTPFLLKVFADFIPADFHLSFRQPIVYGFLLALILTVSLLAGLYPSLVLSSFKPVLVLKNQAFAGSGKTRSAWLRKSLTVSQFVIAQVFIIATLLVSQQIDYELNADMGFKKEAILYFRTNYRQPTAKKAVLMNKLRTIPGIAMVSIATDPPSANSTWTSTMRYHNGKEEIKENVQVKLADSNYFRLYGLRLLAGTPASQSDTTNALVINETYAHILGFRDLQQAIGRTIEWSGHRTITGVAADFHQKSLHVVIQPLAIANGTDRARSFSIALRPESADGKAWPATIAAMEKAFKEVYPDDDCEYHFLDESIAKYYTAEQSMVRLLAWSTGLIIFISCLGLLGLVIYITNQRTKEIGIRKVIGATVANLVFLLSRDFLKPIALAILIAAPIAWWGGNKWLQNFAYRTTLSGWVFFVGCGALFLIALIILCLRTFRAAVANPIESLRTE